MRVITCVECGGGEVRDCAPDGTGNCENCGRRVRFVIQDRPDSPEFTWRCPDGGYCHHSCQHACWRVCFAGPLSNVFPNDEWPIALERRHRDLRDAAGEWKTVVP